MKIPLKIVKFLMDIIKLHNLNSNQLDENLPVKIVSVLSDGK